MVWSAPAMTNLKFLREKSWNIMLWSAPAATNLKFLRESWNIMVL
jgi:hypothetical protein